MAYKPSIRTVSEGCTGTAANVAYAVLCAGATSTSAFQSVASLGVSGSVLTSNGPGVLPSFQASSGGNNLVWTIQTLTGNPGSVITYTLGNATALSAALSTTSARSRLYIPTNGTIVAVYGGVTVQGTLASSETVTLSVRLNNTTDTTITSSLTLTATSQSFSNNALSIAVVSGDYIEIKWVGPSWTTSPTTVRASVSILMN